MYVNINNKVAVSVCNITVGYIQNDDRQREREGVFV